MPITGQDTAADFYVGRGENARYLGTRQYGSPDLLSAWSAFSSPDQDTTEYTVDDYVATVRRLLEVRGCEPLEIDPADMPFSYSFDKGAVYVDHGGYLAAVIYSNGSRKRSVFPPRTG